MEKHPMEKHPSPSTKPITQPVVISLSCWFSAPTGLSLHIDEVYGEYRPDTPGFPAYSRVFYRIVTDPGGNELFCHLRTVIVTAAVYRGLVSALCRPKPANAST